MCGLVVRSKENDGLVLPLFQGTQIFSTAQIARVSKVSNVRWSAAFSMSVLSPSRLYLVICNIFIARCRAPQEMTPRRIVPSTIPYCLRFPDSLMVLRRSSAHRRCPPFSPLALPFPLILSLRSFWRRDGGRTDVACRAVPNEDQRSTRAAGTSECPPTSSRTHPTLRRSRLPSVARCCESRYGIPYAYAGGNTRQAVPWRMSLSIHPSIARRWIRLVILRLSEKARSLSQSRRRGGGEEAKRKLKTTVRQSDRRTWARERLNFIPRGIAELAFEFLSITSPRYFCPYLGNYFRRSVGEPKTSGLTIGDFTIGRC